MSTDERFDETLPEELKAIETVLRRLSPNSQAVHRDRLMYLAGRASAAQPSALGRMWPISTAALLLVSCVLGSLLLSSTHNRQQIGTLENTPGVPSVIANGSQSKNDRRIDLAVMAPSSSSYLALRNAVLAGGVDSLPSPVSAGRILDTTDTIPSTPQDIRDFGG